jgi:uncharacterized protein DUF3303
MLFMIVERFKGRDPRPIYQRLHESGRHLPDGLTYIDSWIEGNFDRQLMETDDPRSLQRWIAEWNDLVEFEIVPVVGSKQVRQMFEPAAAQDAPQ